MGLFKTCRARGARLACGFCESSHATRPQGFGQRRIQINVPRTEAPRVTRDNPGSIVSRLRALEVEHRDLDEIVTRLARQPDIDELLLKRLKRRKLLLKDQIAQLRSLLIPNLDA